jgi:H+/Cl- antiporter ClcA
MQIKELKGKTALPLPGWIAVFIAGGLIEGVGRFFAWRDNPLNIWHEWAPLAATAIAIFTGVYGYFQFLKGKDLQDDVKKRTGIYIIILGIFMIAVSFLLRPAGTPLIQG